jgi:hypothetical protein
VRKGYSGSPLGDVFESQIGHWYSDIRHGDEGVRENPYN